MRRYTPLLLILAGYLMLGALYAIRTPDWQAPDEPAHYNYVRQLAAGRLPVMEAGDYDEAYKNEAVASRFAPQYDVSVITYEDWQPPLYYLLLTPVFLLFDGSLLALRLVSLLLGAGVVALAYTAARQLQPDHPWVAWTTAVFVAFLPQHLAIMASVNNDALAELLIAAILLVLIHNSQFTIHHSLLGILLGLGFLTKGTVYPMTAVVSLALLRQFWGNWRGLVRAGLQLFVPALLLGLLWWGRNLAVYGGLDFLGKAAHDAVVVGQPRTADWVAELGAAEVARRFISTTFHSFWGQFGWMAAPFAPRVYALLWLFSAIVAAGLITLIYRRHSNRAFILTPQWLALIAALVLTLGVHAGYNLTFVQHQGRYLFPALLPIGLGVALGLGAWARPLARRRPAVTILLPIGLAAALISLNLIALFRIIPGALA
ncbi:MAG: DUF2142 domain-containing protein [Anaerolineae bacterium]